MSNVQPNPLEKLVAPGTVVSGKYRVDRVIGVGGMGVVVEAWHLDFDERIAIKFLSPSLCTNQEAVARFEREARVLYKIKSPHVCRVLDIGRLSGGSPFLVLEFLEGEDLANRLTHRKASPLQDAIDWTVQACDAVAEAHARGIVHRDIKPENLFLARSADGNARIKVLDFGLSKIAVPGPSERQRALTSTEQSMGTPHYMSPEQWLSARDVGPASDQWSLAVILYELLCGLPPFDGEQLPQVCSAVLHGPMPSIRERARQVPVDVERALKRALEKEPGQRFAHLGEFAQAIAPYGRSESRAIAERIGRMFEQADVLLQSAEIARLSASSLAALRASFPGALPAAVDPAKAAPSKPSPAPVPSNEVAEPAAPAATRSEPAAVVGAAPEAEASPSEPDLLEPKPDSTGRVPMLDPRDLMTLPPGQVSPPSLPPPSVRKRKKLPPPSRSSSPGFRPPEAPTVAADAASSPSLRKRSQTAQSWQRIHLDRPSRSSKQARRAGLIAFVSALVVLGLVGVVVAPRVADSVRSDQATPAVGATSDTATALTTLAPRTAAPSAASAESPATTPSALPSATAVGATPNLASPSSSTAWPPAQPTLKTTAWPPVTSKTSTPMRTTTPAPMPSSSAPRPKGSAGSIFDSR